MKPISAIPFHNYQKGMHSAVWGHKMRHQFHVGMERPSSAGEDDIYDDLWKIMGDKWTEYAGERDEVWFKKM